MFSFFFFQDEISLLFIPDVDFLGPSIISKNDAYGGKHITIVLLGNL